MKKIKLIVFVFLVTCSAVNVVSAQTPAPTSAVCPECVFETPVPPEFPTPPALSGVAAGMRGLATVVASSRDDVISYTREITINFAYASSTSIVRVVRILNVFPSLHYVIITMIAIVLFRAACMATRFLIRNMERIINALNFFVTIAHAIRSAITDFIELFTPVLLLVFILSLLSAGAVSAQGPTPTPTPGTIPGTIPLLTSTITSDPSAQLVADWGFSCADVEAQGKIWVITFNSYHQLDIILVLGLAGALYAWIRRLIAIVPPEPPSTP